MNRKKIKTFIETYNWNEIGLFALMITTFGLSGWSLYTIMIEPYFTGQLTTLTWLGVILSSASVTATIVLWEHFTTDVDA